MNLGSRNCSLAYLETNLDFGLEASKGSILGKRKSIPITPRSMATLLRIEPRRRASLCGELLQFGFWSIFDTVDQCVHLW